MSHHIDKIIYINLDKRNDRREEIEADLIKYSLSAERFPGIYHDPGIVGCGKSHLAVMKLAKERGYKNVLILEDDFTFLVSKEELEKALDSFFTSGIEYDVCMLCCSIIKRDENSPTDYLYRLLEASNASAYIVNGNYLDKIIELYEKTLPLLESTGMHWVYANDQSWKSLQKTDKWFVFNPRLGKQQSGYSDNAKRFMDYDT